MWWRARAALIRPAAPADALVWPICDLTEPRVHQGLSASPNTSRKALTSTASPTLVPVPWASIRPMLSGVTPAWL